MGCMRGQRWRAVCQPLDAVDDFQRGQRGSFDDVGGHAVAADGAARMFDRQRGLALGIAAGVGLLAGLLLASGRRSA